MSKIKSRRISSPLLLGLFIISASVILIAVIIWLGASEFLEENVYYNTYFKGSVQGLETGSAVKYQGVPVGSVSAVRVAPDGILIEVILQIDKGVDINDSLRATAEMAGIAGGKYIHLFYPTENNLKHMYPELSFKPQYPVIKSAPSGFQEIEIAARQVMNNLMLLEVGKISDGTIKFLDETTGFIESSDRFINDKKLQDIMENFKTSSERLMNILSRADTSDVLANIANTTEHLLEAARGLEEFAVNLNAEIDSIGFPQKFQNIVDQYDSAMSTTRKVINQIGFRTETALFSLTELLEDMKNTNIQLKRSLRAMSNDPSNVFLSEPPPKEE